MEEGAGDFCLSGFLLPLLVFYLCQLMGVGGGGVKSSENKDLGVMLLLGSGGNSYWLLSDGLLKIELEESELTECIFFCYVHHVTYDA